MKISSLLLLACCLAGCATKPHQPPPPDPIVAANGLPDPDSKLSPEQIQQLKSRLDQLRVGMSRERVLDILDLSSFNVRSYADSKSSGLSYNFAQNHTLTLGMEAGDYDSTLRWARFDGEMWPKHDAAPK